MKLLKKLMELGSKVLGSKRGKAASSGKAPGASRARSGRKSDAKKVSGKKIQGGASAGKGAPKRRVAPPKAGEKTDSAAKSRAGRPAGRGRAENRRPDGGKEARKALPKNIDADLNVKVRQRKDPSELPAPKSLEELKVRVAEFQKLGLGEKVLSAVDDMGYSEPTPIQGQAIPEVLAGRDVIGTAQTGTGKTAAFALPIVQLLEASADDTFGKACVLVLSPTRELSTQTAEAFANFSKYADLHVALVQGGVSMRPQIRAIKSGAEIIVATPGRLLDLMRQGVLSLGEVRYLVLDEVDRMFDMGFIEDVSEIIRHCPKSRQTLFFSATMPDAVMRLSEWALKEPVFLKNGIATPAETIEHYVYPVDGIQKYDLLIEFLKTIKFDSLIVFTRTRIDADRISEWLVGHGYKVSTLHSDRTQHERDKALQDFRDSKTNILVATDIASRGLGISNVGYVINYNVPEHSEDYVHRIGRTGRANHDGTAVTFFASEETEFLKRIEALIGSRIERRKLEGFPYRNEPVLEEAHKRSRRRNR